PTSTANFPPPAPNQSPFTSTPASPARNSRPLSAALRIRSFTGQCLRLRFLVMNLSFGSWRSTRARAALRKTFFFAFDYFGLDPCRGCWPLLDFSLYSVRRACIDGARRPLGLTRLLTRHGNVPSRIKVRFPCPREL